MSIITDVLTAARGGIQERDERIADLEKRLDSMTDSRAYFRRERDVCLELVKEAGEKHAELENRLAAAEAEARRFAEEFGFPVAVDEEPVAVGDAKPAETDDTGEAETAVMPAGEFLAEAEAMAEAGGEEA